MANGMARLAQAIADRRRALGRSQIGVWRSGGPSNSTLTRLENGEGDPPSPSTLRKLDKGLDWVPGSAAAVLNGGSPTSLTPLFIDRNAEPDYVVNDEIGNVEDQPAPSPLSSRSPRDDSKRTRMTLGVKRRLVIEADRAAEYDMRMATEEGAISPESLDAYRRAIRRDLEDVVVSYASSPGALAALLRDVDYTTIDDLYSQISGTKSSEIDLAEVTRALKGDEHEKPQEDD